MVSQAEILDFWFGRLPGETGSGRCRQVWFAKQPAFDQEIQTRFGAVYAQAATGALDTWQETPAGCLALILLLDQFPRHLFRGDPRAFATDGKALALTQLAIARGFDQTLPPVQRWFLYLPLMHSENWDHQQRSVELFATLQHDPDVATAYPYAIKHRDIIQRFGRFPHRNAMLGRVNTPAEAAFLQQPGSAF